MTWTYPTDQLDDLQVLRTLTSAFWTELFGGADNVLDLLRAWRLAERQLFSQQQELQDTVGLSTCPPWHVRNWYKLVLLQSQVVEAANGAVTYPLPAEVKDCLYLASGLTAPVMTWHRGVTFDLDVSKSLSLFASDPFAEPGLTPDPVLTNGVVTDQSLTLWLFKASVDWLYLWQQFGYVVGIQADSSLACRDLLQAVYSALTSETSLDSVAAVVEAVADVPRVRGSSETVQVITSDASRDLIITDQNVYAFTLGVTPVVGVGDAVRQGDQLADAVQLVEPLNGQIPSFLQQLSLGQGFLLADIPNELIFADATVSLNVQTGVSGFTKLSWALGGFANDVTTFFNDLHSRGVSNGATLANYMDLRTVRVGQPGPGDLPSTINPLAFLFQNVLRNNCLVVYLRVSQFGPNALNVDLSQVLRKILPPHVAIIICADLQQAEEVVTMSGAGSPSAPGVAEDYVLSTVPG